MTCTRADVLGLALVEHQAVPSPRCEVGEHEQVPETSAPSTARLPGAAGGRGRSRAFSYWRPCPRPEVTGRCPAGPGRTSRGRPRSDRPLEAGAGVADWAPGRRGVAAGLGEHLDLDVLVAVEDGRLPGGHRSTRQERVVDARTERRSMSAASDPTLSTSARGCSLGKREREITLRGTGSRIPQPTTARAPPGPRAVGGGGG